MLPHGKGGPGSGRLSLERRAHARSGDEGAEQGSAGRAGGASRPGSPGRVAAGRAGAAAGSGDWTAEGDAALECGALLGSPRHSQTERFV